MYILTLNETKILCFHPVYNYYQVNLYKILKISGV